MIHPIVALYLGHTRPSEVQDKTTESTMSDHIDGPRQIGDPAGDLTDLFAFTSPENPARTVLAACLFPSAGADAMFSNAVSCSIVVRRGCRGGSW